MIDVWFSALLLGLLGAGHCLGMCGGFAAALAYAIPSTQHGRRFILLLAYNLGRISSYALLGAVVALGQNALFDSGYPLARTVAGLLLIATGLYLADIWRGITLLERAGQQLWRFVQPLSHALLPVYTLPKAYVLGALWGWLPCGLVYSVLTLAATQPTAGAGALTMAAFGAGTLPAVFAGGLAAVWVRGLMAKRWVKRGLASGFILFGVWTIAVAWYHNSHHHNHNAAHQDSSAPATPADLHQHHH